MSDASLKQRPRRILALILPDLLVELAQRQRLAQHREHAGEHAASNDAHEPHRLTPLGVVVMDEPERREPKQLSLGGLGTPEPEPALPATEPLAAVNREAERYGVRPAQTIAEASALVSQLVVVKVRRAEVEKSLNGLAEVALSYGATVARAAPDTVWVDITGSAHLFGGEAALARDLAERVRELGHRTKVAVSVGPELAQAFARWLTPPRNSGAVSIISSSSTDVAAAELPIQALPLSPENLGYLGRLGLLSWGDLVRQPRSGLAPRLGKDAARVLELCAGRDNAPLVVYQPARIIEEENHWDDPVTGTEPLGFVLRGLAARISARLCARGEAAESLDVTLRHDAMVARFRGVPLETTLHFKLSQPLHREADLRRIVASRLERLKLGAPTLGMKLTVARLAPMVKRQLSLSELMQGDTSKGEEDLPLVLAELCADIGEARVGVLSLVDAHRPEQQSGLQAALPEQMTAKRRSKKPKSDAERAQPRGALRKTEPPIWSKLPSPPTRLLTQPIELASTIAPGNTLVLGHTLYTIERLRFEQRLEGVEWWSQPVARDYLRLWLSSETGGLEALVYVDRHSGRRFLQAVGD